VLFAGLAIILFFSFSTFFDGSRQVYHCDPDLDSTQADGGHTEWGDDSLVGADPQLLMVNPTPKHVVSEELKAAPSLPIAQESKKQDEVKKPRPKERDKQKNARVGCHVNSVFGSVTGLIMVTGSRAQTAGS